MPRPAELDFKLTDRQAYNSFQAQHLLRNRPSCALQLTVIDLNRPDKAPRFLLKSPAADSLAELLVRQGVEIKDLNFWSSFFVALARACDELTERLLAVQEDLLILDLVYYREGQVFLPCLPAKIDRIKLPASYATSQSLPAWLSGHQDPTNKPYVDSYLKLWSACMAGRSKAVIKCLEAMQATQQQDLALLIKQVKKLTSRQQSVVKQNKKTKAVPLSKADNKGQASRSKPERQSVWSKIINPLRQKQQQHDLAFEATRPLSPDALNFRLAMLSEGLPGSPQELEGRRSFILQDEFIVGRDRAICDLVVSQDTVSRQHARIVRHGSSYFIEDLGSTNSSYLDGKRLNKRQAYLLPDRCRVKFADQAFYFYVED